MLWGGHGNHSHHATSKKEAIEDAARYVRMALLVEDADTATACPEHVRRVITMPRTVQIERYGQELNPRTRVRVARLPPVTMARILWRVRWRYLP
jgi:hypothetical protein